MSTVTGTDPPAAALHAADSHDLIRVHGARENNLKDVSVEIPKRRLTVFTGVSGLGQELAGLRHDRRRVAAADQRDLQRLRAGLHADAGPARRRRARRPDHRDHRRPGADGRQLALHGRHRDRRQRDAAHPLQPARAAAHRLAQRVLVQRPLGPGERRHHRGARRQDPDQGGDLQPPGGMCPRCEGIGAVTDYRPVAAVRRQQVAQRGRDHDPGLQHGRLVRPHLRGVRASSTPTSRSATSPSRSCTTSSTRSRPRSRSTAST